MIREFLRDVGPVLAILIALMFVLIGTISVPMFYLNYVHCRNTAAVMEREYVWGITTGCLVRATDGQMVPLENFRKFSEE